MTDEEYDKLEGKWNSRTHVTIDEVAEFTQFSRQTVTERLAVFKTTMPGPNGARLYLKEPAYLVVCSGCNFERQTSPPQKLKMADVSRIKSIFLEANLQLLDKRLAPITTVARVKAEVRKFLRELEEEANHLHHELFKKVHAGRYDD